MRPTRGPPRGVLRPPPHPHKIPSVLSSFNRHPPSQTVSNAATKTRACASASRAIPPRFLSHHHPPLPCTTPTPVPPSFNPHTLITIIQPPHICHHHSTPTPVPPPINPHTCATIIHHLLPIPPPPLPLRSVWRSFVQIGAGAPPPPSNFSNTFDKTQLLSYFCSNIVVKT